MKITSIKLRTLRTDKKAAATGKMVKTTVKSTGSRLGKSKLIVTKDGKKVRTRKENSAKPKNGS